MNYTKKVCFTTFIQRRWSGLARAANHQRIRSQEGALRRVAYPGNVWLKLERRKFTGQSSDWFFRCLTTHSCVQQHHLRQNQVQQVITETVSCRTSSMYRSTTVLSHCKTNTCACTCMYVCQMTSVVIQLNPEYVRCILHHCVSIHVTYFIVWSLYVRLQRSAVIGSGYLCSPKNMMVVVHAFYVKQTNNKIKTLVKTERYET